MTFFSRLFGKRPEAAQTLTPATLEAVPSIARDLFTEDMHPSEFEEEAVQKEVRIEQTLLDSLLSRDYEEMGYKDGFRMHDLTRMEIQLEVMASDFRQAYDMELQDIEVQMGAL